MVTKVATNLRRLRKQVGLTQTELSDKLGVSLRTVGSWEQGQTVPNAEQLCKCARTLNCSPNEILGWSEDDLLPLSHAERKLIKDYRGCSDDWKVNVSMISHVGNLESINLLR